MEFRNDFTNLWAGENREWENVWVSALGFGDNVVINMSILKQCIRVKLCKFWYMPQMFGAKEVHMDISAMMKQNMLCML